MFGTKDLQLMSPDPLLFSVEGAWLRQTRAVLDVREKFSVLHVNNHIWAWNHDTYCHEVVGNLVATAVDIHAFLVEWHPFTPVLRAFCIFSFTEGGEKYVW